ncbi:G-D-S-L family lipolytic protein [uncultured Christiangramia sp.]|uniref:SGNH/GDSL hydrolase family protein n=1 Tax=uncultured Christiangramia sp. TaxID=503836 RepID=UPI00262BD4E5|nr:G-D-S-L family lipolytic protein [uncultured Christiangramia sp.]
MKNYFKYMAILALGIVSCEPELENSIEDGDFYTSGEADFSNYVALGNSLTAGYADGALYLSGQQNSFPSILAEKFSAVQETGEFIQPLVNDNAGGLLLGGNQITQNRFVLAVGANGPSPARYTGAQPTTEVSNKFAGPVNNMGVPGAKSYHLLAENYGSVAGVAAGTANPYFARFSSSESATVLQDALAQEPTFFTLWIGNNDVLSYATSGGSGEYQLNNFDPRTYGENDITDPTVFAMLYRQMAEALAQNADGVLVNIPNVASVPYFTTVPFAPLNPADEDFGPQIPTLNATFAPLNQAFAFLGVPERSVNFATDAASPVLIKDESLTDISTQLTEVLIGGGIDPATATLYGMQYGQSRQATAEDLLVLTSAGVIGSVNQQRVQELMGLGLDQQTAGQLSVNGVTYPMEDQFVLTDSEQGFVESATTAYNIAISQIAETNGLGYVDANALLNQLDNGGISFDGGSVNSDFVTGGAFSLDGVHLTPRGYAIIANAIIDEINATYGSNVPKANVGSYGTVTLSQDVQ